MEKIHDILGKWLVDLQKIKEVSPNVIENYIFLILDIPTWDYGGNSGDWEVV